METQMMVGCLLAEAGLTDVAFAQAVVGLMLSGLAWLLGISAAVLSLTARRKAAVLLAVVALLVICAYVVWHWVSNGSESWEHAGRYLIAHAMLAGLPALLAFFGIVVAMLQPGRA